METLIKDLKNLMPFKDTIAAGDVVLIAAKKPQMLVYGLVTDIVRDETKRDEWWHVSMHLLALPPQKITWTLRTEQMTGREIFTMEGEERFMKPVRLDTGERKPPKLEIKQEKPGKSTLRRIK